MLNESRHLPQRRQPMLRKRKWNLLGDSREPKTGILLLIAQKRNPDWINRHQNKQWCRLDVCPNLHLQTDILHPTVHCEPTRARFPSIYMPKWLFHSFSRWMNDVWIEIVFSSGKIHTLHVWDSFVSNLVFSSYYKQRKSIREVFSPLDQFQPKIRNVVF